MRPSLAAVGLGLLGLLVLGLAGPMHRIGLPLGMAFTLLRFAAYIGLVAVAVGVGVAAWHLKKSARLAAGVAVLGVLCGLVATVIPWSWQRRAQRLPVIHDVSTDLENPPAFVKAVALRDGSPNGLERGADVTQQQRQGYPDLAPLTLAEPSGQVLARARATAERLGWEIVSVDERAGLIEATDTSRWFGFVDDVAVRVTPWGAGTRVDLRSVSREGRSDVGSNADRIRAFLSALQEP